MYVIPEHKYIIVRSAASVVVSSPRLSRPLFSEKGVQQAMCSVSKRVNHSHTISLHISPGI